MRDTKPTTVLSALLGDTEGKMTIHQCQRIAKDLVLEGTESGQVYFDLTGPKGSVHCV